MAGTLDGALRSDITVRTEIAPDLGTSNAGRRRHHRCGAECRSFRWRGPWGFVEIVADDGKGMPEEGLSPALTSYFKKGPGSGPPASGSTRSSASPKDEAARSV
jgi:hypothetical protein